MIMTLDRCLNLKHLLKIMLFIFIISVILPECFCDCGLLKPLMPNETADEQKLLMKIKPLIGKSFQVKDIVGTSEYTYEVAICHEINGLKKPGIGAIQFDVNQTHILGRYDQTDIMGGTNWIQLTYYGGENYHNHCNYTGRTAKIMIICDPDVEVGKFEILEERKINPEDCFYIFELGSNVACSPKPKTGLSSGSVFCILFFTLVLVYLVCGFLYQRIVVGAKGLDQIPNYTFWRDFGNLQADGCNFFCRFGPRQESHSYRGIDDHLKDEEERDDHLLNW